MTIEDRLKELILDRYGSVRRFTQLIDIPYSTVASIFKRGINNANIDNILTICEALHISADALAKGRIEPSRSIIKNPTDITDILANARAELLNNHALMFNGKPADEESIQAIIDAMEVGIELAKRKIKDKE